MKSRLHKTATVDTYELHLRNHIAPAFGAFWPSRYKAHYGAAVD